MFWTQASLASVEPGIRRALPSCREHGTACDTEVGRSGVFDIGARELMARVAGLGFRLVAKSVVGPRRKTPFALIKAPTEHACVRFYERQAGDEHN